MNQFCARPFNWGSIEFCRHQKILIKNNQKKKENILNAQRVVNHKSCKFVTIQCVRTILCSVRIADRIYWNQNKNLKDKQRELYIQIDRAAWESTFHFGRWSIEYSEPLSWSDYDDHRHKYRTTKHLNNVERTQLHKNDGWRKFTFAGQSKSWLSHHHIVPAAGDDAQGFEYTSDRCQIVIVHESQA